MLENKDLYRFLHESIKPEIIKMTERVYINEAISLLNSYGSYEALCCDLDALDLFNLYLGKKGSCGPGGLVVDYNDDGSIQVDSSDYSSLVIGGTGKGKSRRCSIVSLETMILSGQNVVVTDSKGEMLRSTRNLLGLMGYKVYVVDFQNPQRSAHYNLLKPAYEAWHVGDRDRARMIISSLLETLVPEDNESAYWTTEAKETLCSFACGMLEYGVSQDEFSLYSLSMMTYCNSTEKRKKLSTFFRLCLKDGSLSSLGASGFFDNASDTRACISSFMHASINPLSSLEALVEICSTDTDFDATTLVENQKVAVYIICPDTMPVYTPAATAIISQLLTGLIDIADVYYDGSLPEKVTFLLEEFGNISVKIPSFTRVLSTCRSRKIRLMLLLQSVSQLDRVYSREERRIITSNITNQIFFGCGDFDYVEEMSKRFGNHEGKNDKPILSISALQSLRCSDTSSEAVVQLGGIGPYVTAMKDYSGFTEVIPCTPLRVEYGKHEPFSKIPYFNVEDVVDKRFRDMIDSRLKGKGAVDNV